MNQKILPVLIVLLVIASFLAGSFWTRIQNLEKGKNDTQNIAQVTPSAVKPTSAPVDDQTFAKLASGRNTKGNPNAKVTIVEFSDFECPYCGRFFKETLPSIEKDYIKTNKVKYVFYNYPLPFHQNAQKASEAAECAGDQGKFWEMHDALYADQTKLAVADLKKTAAGLGLDMTKFNSCLDGSTKKDIVAADLALGQSVGVNGTPAFFVNGKLLSGALPYDSFKQVIDAELSK